MKFQFGMKPPGADQKKGAGVVGLYVNGPREAVLTSPSCLGLPLCWNGPTFALGSPRRGSAGTAGISGLTTTRIALLDSSATMP